MRNRDEEPLGRRRLSRRSWAAAALTAGVAHMGVAAGQTAGTSPQEGGTGEALLDRVYGAIIASAIGDALAAPTETSYPEEIQKKHGRLADLVPYTNVGYSSGKAGAITDDTSLRHYMCLAIVRNMGRITPSDAAKVWTEDVNPSRFWSPDKIAQMKMKAGVDPWEAGRGNIPNACATMAMIPIGIINAGNPKQAYQDGYCISGMNGDGVDRTAPAVIASGIAEALTPGAGVDSILARMTQFSPWQLRRAIELTLETVDVSDGYSDFRGKFYARLADWWSRPKPAWSTKKFPIGTSVESVSVAMALFRMSRGDVNACLIEGANFGRDSDAIASISAGLCGALNGTKNIRRDWIEKLETINEPFFAEVEKDPKANFRSMAVRLVAALRAERSAALARVEMLDRMLRA